MALVAPMLMALLFGSVELGNFFWNEHVVIKAVRDGARYAARQPMSNYFNASSGCLDPDADLTDKVTNVVRTGAVGDGGTARLSYWTDTSTIDFTVECRAQSETEGDVTGIYNGMTYDGDAVGAPVVIIKATVPYRSLFGFDYVTTYPLTASQESAVMGY
jgi:Flp pilus assembly protein TadG